VEKSNGEDWTSTNRRLYKSHPSRIKSTVDLYTAYSGQKRFLESFWLKLGVGEVVIRFVLMLELMVIGLYTCCASFGCWRRAKMRTFAQCQRRKTGLGTEKRLSGERQECYEYIERVEVEY